jgi:2-polyprenyl-3-methyl-5-hydroxy-6-metoxy-1,4-benzoquinol methylase
VTVKDRGAFRQISHTPSYFLHRFAVCWYQTIDMRDLPGREVRGKRCWTVELAQVKPGEKALDVGCGTGTLTLVARRWAGPEGEVHGLDAAPKMIAVARRKAAEAGVAVDFQVGLIEDIPIQTGRTRFRVLSYLSGERASEGEVVF